jgi:hypothetical protein
LGKYVFDFWGKHQHERMPDSQNTHAFAMAKKLLDFTIGQGHQLPAGFYTRGLMAYLTHDFATAVQYVV